MRALHKEELFIDPCNICLKELQSREGQQLGKAG